MKSELKEARQAIDRFETQQGIVPVTIEMPGFNGLKVSNSTWYSRPFYTGMGGYKMCLSVPANVCGIRSQVSGDFEGTRVSVQCSR